MSYVKPKKSLGQHFLTDHNIAKKIVDSLEAKVSDILEVGPGMGILTQYLLQRAELNIHVIEIDKESIYYLENNFPGLKKIVHGDFLKQDLSGIMGGDFCVIGNFPYNISSQIFFRILDERDHIPEIVGMIQKEVAERISTAEGSKTYGILSVLLQAFYDIDYLFTVPETVFNPPPRVKSAVVRLRRNNRTSLPCDEKLFFRVVKSAFNQRRKMLRNSLKGFGGELQEGHAQKRPEQLSVQDFIDLTCSLENL